MVLPPGAYAFAGRGRGRGRGRGGGRGGSSRGQGRGGYGVPPPEKAHKSTREMVAYPEERGGAYRPMGAALTIQEIEGDRLTHLAQENWSAAAKAKPNPPAFNPQIIEDIYSTELHGGNKPPSLRRIMLLEVSQYLESYLWPNFDAEASTAAHVLSIAAMVCEKARENVPAWACFDDRPDSFRQLFARLLTIKAEKQLSQQERVMYLLFMIHAFQSLENAAVWEQVRQLVGLNLWTALSPGRRKLELHQHPMLAKRWRAQERREAKQEAAAAAAGSPFIPLAQRPDTQLLPSLMDEFLEVLSSIVPEAIEKPAEATQQLPQQALLHCERFVEFLVDLLSQLPTHRFVRALLEDRAILVKCQLSGLYQHPSGGLFTQLTDMLRFYLAFPIDPIEGEPLTDDQVVARHYGRVQLLQRLLFKHHPQLQALALANCGAVASRSRLAEAVRGLDEAVLRTLVTKQLRLVDGDDAWAHSRAFLEDVLLATYEAKTSQTDAVNAMPLYPTEGILWDDNQVPNVHYTGEGCLALPKLNLQFLTTTDYLLRNFHLFRLEATYEIREDIADVLPRFQTHLDDDDKVVFNGWARMAVPLLDFSVIEVRKPNVGENKPASVTADAVFTGAGMRGPIRSEWDQIREHDILFLLSITPPDAATLAGWQTTEAQPKPDELYGLTHVRGCEVIEIKDEEGTLMNDSTGRIRRDEAGPPAGLRRTVTVALDTAQYQLDMNAVRDAGAEDVYSTFNLLMRRKPKENNFKAVLESIRDLLNEHMDAMPTWLHQLFLGYGLPDSAHYTHIPNLLTDIDFKDTFLDAQHLRASFPEYEVEVINGTDQPEPVRPFRVMFPSAADSAPLANGHAQPPAAAKPSGKRKRADAAGASSAPAAAAAPSGAVQAPSTAEDDVSMSDAPPQQKPKLIARSYVPPDPGPYPENKPPENTVRFTPVQVEAIKAGVQPGLTMVVGPPGTGKTDTAVQIMHVLYHNCPGQRTLLIAHSNQALNDLFEKLLQRDVPARYLLRLGQGESELAAQGDFSRVGRVNAMLARRLTLLAEVERMAKQMGVAGDVSYTCETAAHFWLLHVLSRWEKFLATAQQLRTDACVQELFPFQEYFADAPGGLFRGGGFEADMERARGAFRHLQTMFQELEECRAFELLKGQADRVNYLMTKQAKVVAMTCTHAALRRGEFLRLGFQYDNLLMEESAQILEIETFIPLLLQKAVDGQSRLKRVTLIGDHHQLPPVVKNMAFQKYSHLDQSLFTRFIRLGVPTVQLNAQGRARPSLARLYNWRYTGLGDLPNISTQPEYLRANPGMAYEYQLIDVGDAEESAPLPYFYQNVEEARRLVTLYQYLRLRGYPANKISILTTYNGQKALLREEIDNRCVNNPAVRELYGRPHKVTTVDKYQGQQNDYVLLSLVRTRAVGHLRDVRRLVVAMSRARLGLYVFGRAQLFANCYEMAPALQQLLAQPLHFALHPQETWQDCERPAAEVGSPLIIQDPAQLADLVNRQTAEKLTAAQTAAAPVAAEPTAAEGSAAAM